MRGNDINITLLFRAIRALYGDSVHSPQVRRVLLCVAISGGFLQQLNGTKKPCPPRVRTPWLA